MRAYDTRPAMELSLLEMADLFTRSFAGYFVPMNITPPILASLLQRDGVDLSLSTILVAGDKPAGFGLIARRGWTSRLAAMGIIEEFRGKGAGSYLTSQLVRAAGERADKRMVLEVIEQNTRAIATYEKHGFKRSRRLLGLTAFSPASLPDCNLEEIDIRRVAGLVTQHGLSDLPWQVSGESLAAFAPPARAYKLGSAYAIVTDPAVEHVQIRALLVDPPARRHGEATRLLRAIFATHPAKTWHVPAIFPEEIVAPFQKLGFIPDKISQWQMSLALV